MPTFHALSTVPRAKVAFIYGTTSALGALALFLIAMTPVAGLALQIATLAVLTAGFALLTWIVSGKICTLATASRKLEMRKAVDALVGKRTAHLEAANAELTRQARTDPLTGLLNRRGFEIQAKAALTLARRRRSPVSVLILDIDHFKRVNDTYGHPVGDSVIKLLADTLVARLRESDVIARIGGEEFAIILTDADAASAVTVANGIVLAIARLKVPVVGRFTVSAGVALAHLSGSAIDTVESVIERADEALYMAKDQGRNQVCIQELLDTEPKRLRVA